MVSRPLTPAVLQVKRLVDTITGFTQGTLQVERVVLRRAAHGLAELAKTGGCPAPAAPACFNGCNSFPWGPGAWVRVRRPRTAEI